MPNDAGLMCQDIPSIGMLEYYVKLPPSSLYEAYIKHEHILCLNLSPISNIFHYMYQNILKSPEALLDLNHSCKGIFTYEIAKIWDSQF